MPETDPLALRHGAFIAAVWAQIGEARKLAASHPTTNQSATQLRRIRHLRSKVVKAHRTEMQRQDFSTPAIDAWFQPVEQCLDKAETYFAARIASTKVVASMSLDAHHAPQ